MVIIAKSCSGNCEFNVCVISIYYPPPSPGLFRLCFLCVFFFILSFFFYSHFLVLQNFLL